MQGILLLIFPIVFGFGVICILASDPASVIQKSGHSDILEDKPFYGINHMKKVISLSSNHKIIEKLKRKILIRKIGYALLITIPFLVLINNLLSK